MLVLTRGSGEKISIDNGRITITVVKVGANRVTFVIDAPKDASIKRPRLVSEGM